MNASASETPLSSDGLPGDHQAAVVTPPAPGVTPPATAQASDDLRSLDLEDALQALPPYTRSLLRIKVPVAVTLATTRRSLQRLLELGPGSIIQFNKPSDAPLTLEISNTTVALGEAVKVGDKYGVWITSIVMPSERFVTLAPPPSK